VFHFGTVRLGCVSQAVASFACFPGIFRAAAQTPQPWLFVETIANGKVTGAVTFLRDDSSGALTRLANSQTTFTNPCGPSMIDPKGRFLYLRERTFDVFGECEHPCTRGERLR
jgi:hypothetical protein